MYLFPAVCSTFPCLPTCVDRVSNSMQSNWERVIFFPWVLVLEILVTKSFSVSQNPTWRPRGHWCYLIVFHVREEVTSFLGFLLGISVMQEFYLVANPQGKTFVFQKCHSFVERFVQFLQMYIACNMQSSIQRKWTPHYQLFSPTSVCIFSIVFSTRHLSFWRE